MIYIAGQPHVLLGGANSEALDNAAILRAADIPVTLVHYSTPHPALVETAKSLGMKVEAYRPGIFKDQIVAGWCHLPYLQSLADSGNRPKCAVWFNCMTSTSKIERFLHSQGSIDRFGFVSAYQKRLVCAELQKEIKEFTGYAPPFTTAWRQFKTQNGRKMVTSTVGVITRDDPTKVNPCIFDIFRRSQAKRLTWLGWGDACIKAFPQFTVDTVREFDPILPTAIQVDAFYSNIDVCVHIPGPAGESFCRIMLESAEADVPFLASRSHAFPEFLNGDCSWQLCGTETEFVSAINQIIASPDCAKSMAQAQKRHLRSQQFNERCLRAWQNLIKEVA